MSQPDHSFGKTAKDGISFAFFRSFNQLNHSKQSVIWILLLLIVLFIAGIWVMSNLNLKFSQNAMSDLRRVQLQEAFYANLDRINSQHHLLNRYSEDLATLGELFWSLQQNDVPYLKRELDAALFGIGVPRNEIDAVLQPMRKGNYRILLSTGLTMLLLSTLMLFGVIGLMRRLQASYTDELTRLPNRAGLLRHLAEEKSGSLILINLDDFKEINGLFGHRCGDHVLKTVAEFVHSEEVLEKVRQLNIDYSQGSVISMPQPRLMTRQDLEKISRSLTNDHP